MTFSFRPAASIAERHGCFVALVGPPNSGKTYSAMRLARGIAGPKGKVAVADTEGGRTRHLKEHFDFDVTSIEPPHRPQRYAELAKDAEDAGYDVLLIDSFSAEWAGVGGVLEWADQEAQRIAGGDAGKLERSRGASWIKPKGAHKAMVYSLLQRRIPIIFSIRGEESFKPPSEKLFKAVCNQSFLFEVTVSFRLAQDRKGIIDLSDAKTFKMEGVHRDIFKNGEQLSEQHGEALARWAAGGAAPVSQGSDEKARLWVDQIVALMPEQKTEDQLEALRQVNEKKIAALAERAPEQHGRLMAAFGDRYAELAPFSSPS